MTSSSKNGNSSAGKISSPIHLLMGSTAATVNPLLDPRLQNDYVSKRAKRYHRSSKKFKRTFNSVWDGVSRIEKELICCCEEIKAKDQDDNNENEEDRVEGGALDMKQEVRFAGILARDCHTMATKCLALAILEQTMRVYLADKEDDEEDEDGDDDEEETEDEEIDEAPSKDSLNDEGKADAKRKRDDVEEIDEPQMKKTKVSEGDQKNQEEIDHQEDEEEEDDDEEEEEDQVGRLEAFLAAGGLKILNRWLIDASTEEPVITLKRPPGSSQVAEQMEPKPPATRPLILPILRFLEHIPFDKKLVTDSKINKQIKKLGKEVNFIRKARDANDYDPIDLENWVIEPTARNDRDAIDQVADAVKDLKASWERMVKEDPRNFEDPFEAIKTKIRERLDTIIDFEMGKIPKPEWFVVPESPKKSKAKKLSTKELAAKERQREREQRMEELQAADKINKERLEKLRESLRKRKENTTPKVSTFRKDRVQRRVVWKDGMKTQTNRNRKMLEEVFLFVKDTPAARESSSPTALAMEENDFMAIEEDMEHAN